MSVARAQALLAAMLAAAALAWAHVATTTPDTSHAVLAALTAAGAGGAALILALAAVDSHTHTHHLTKD